MPGHQTLERAPLGRARGWEFLSPRRRGPRWLQVTCAVLMVAIATIARALLLGDAPLRFPFTFFYPAIIGSAWLGGFYPGVLATFVSAIASKYLFIAPVRSLVIADQTDLVALLLFLAIGILFSLLSEAVIRAHATNATLLAKHRRSEKRFRTLAANAPVGIFLTDGNGDCLFVNQRWCELAGMTNEEAYGPKWAEAVFEIDRARVASEWQLSVDAGSEWESEFRFLSAAGQVTWVRGNAVANKNGFGEPSEYIGTLIDITNDRHADAERERLLAHAERARQVAEVASRAKDEFLALLSHELRNPLAPIITALELIRMKRDEPSCTHALAIIERQVQHLGRLVDDLLDVSRITRGKIELHRGPVLVRDMIGKAIEMASPLIEQRQHRLVVESLSDRLRVYGDEARLAQVVSNLLTNAARYTNPHGRIVVSAQTVGEQVAISVADNGMGMAPELLPRIFDLFVQGGEQSLDRAEGGLGLGLALVHNLVEMHGGEVEARSAGPGRGSDFVVRLPMLPALHESPPMAPHRTPLPPAPAPAGQRVLLVDDNVDFTEVLGPLLSEIGYQITIAHDGPSALSALSSHGPPFPEIAIIDIGLPVMDGYELAVRLREQVGAQLRLFAMTGYGQPDDLEKSRRFGFERHLVKPVDPTSLAAALAAPAPTAKAV